MLHNLALLLVMLAPIGINGPVCVELNAVASFDQTSYLPSIAVSESRSRLYLAGDVLEVFDVSDPLDPTLVGSWVGHGTPDQLALSGEILYLSDHQGGFVVLDISTDQPTLLRSVSEAAPLPFNLVVAGTLLFVCDDEVFKIFDVNDPVAPAELVAWNVDRTDGNLTFTASENHLYLADSRGLRIVDVSLPSAPSEVGFLPFDQNAPDLTSLSIEVAGDLAFLTQAHGEYDDRDGAFLVFDVSDPSTPVEIGRLPGYFVYLALIDGYAVVSGPDTVLRVIDLSTPSKPRIVARGDAHLGPADFAGLGRYVFVATNRLNDGLRLLKIDHCEVKQSGSGVPTR
jgi:hypothetical protein